MPVSIATKILYFAVLAVAVPAAEGQGRVEVIGQARRFISQKYGFSMAVPPGWGPSTALDTPVYFYSPSRARFVQDQIPKGGAVIAVTAHDMESGRRKAATTPSEWAREDARSFFLSRAPPVSSLEMPRESEASGAVVSSYDEPALSTDERVQHSVAVFWAFNGELFAAHLRYNANDPSGPRLERLFLETIRSLRPIEKTKENGPA